MKSKVRVGGSGITTLTFSVSTITPEEDLRNNAMSVVMGYQQQRLGKRQIAMLQDLHHAVGMSGTNAEGRRVLHSLQRRCLARQGDRLIEWTLTDLGHAVAEALTQIEEDNR